MKRLLLIGVLGVCGLSHAEIVKNSKGEKIELKPNGTWALIKPTPEDFVNDATPYSMEVEDGNKVKISIMVQPDITLMGVGRQLTREEINHEIRMTSLTAQFKLKNRYSYQPKEVRVTQKGRDVKIKIGYTGKNGYGADVASDFESTYYIEETGKLKRTSAMY